MCFTNPHGIKYVIINVNPCTMNLFCSRAKIVKPKFQKQMFTPKYIPENRPKAAESEN